MKCLCIIVFIAVLSLVQAGFCEETFQFEFDEAEYNRLLQVETERFVAQFVAENPHVDARSATTISKRVLESVRESYPVAYVRMNYGIRKEMLKKHGPKAAAIFIAAGVLTELVIPAILVATGNGQILLYGYNLVPYYSVSIPLYLRYVKRKNQKFIRKKMELDSLQHLDQLRDQLIGYSIEKQVLSTVLRMTEEKLRVDVLEKPSWSRRRRGLKDGGAVITVPELEALVKKAYGKEFMKKLMVHAGNRPYYVTRLLTLVTLREDLQKEFLERVRAHIADLPEQDRYQKIAAEQLRELYERRQEVQELIRELRGFQKALRKWKNRTKHQVSRERRDTFIKHFKEIKRFNKHQLQELKVFERGLMYVEYWYLNKIDRAYRGLEPDFEALFSRPPQLLQNAVAEFGYIKDDLTRVELGFESVPDGAKRERFVAMAKRCKDFNGKFLPPPKKTKANPKRKPAMSFDPSCRVVRTIIEAI